MSTKAQCLAIIAPHADRLYECLMGGAEDYDRHCPDGLRAIFGERTATNARRDLIVHRVKTAFDGVPGTTLVETNQLFVLSIESENGAVAIRFHKRDADGRCRRNDTAQTHMFDSGQIWLFPALAPARVPRGATSLIATYNLDPNRIGPAAISVGIGRPDGDGFLWHEILATPARTVIDEATPPAFDDEATASPRKATQVRGRATNTKKVDEQDDPGADD